MARWLSVMAGLLAAILLVWAASSMLRPGIRKPARIFPIAPPPPQIGDADPAALLGQILDSGHVDELALGSMEKRGDATFSATANFVAARYEYEHRRYDPAIRYLRRALEFAPDRAGLHAWYATLLLESGQYAEAVTAGERATQIEPESPDGQRILGLAYYHSGRPREAVSAWEHSLRLAPNQDVQRYLEKAKREAVVEENFTQTARGHFVLRYEGGQPAPELIDELLRTLERQYEELARDLGMTPNRAVAVTLYSREQFFDVTQAPTWAGALNDGKMRIPLGKVSAITPQMEAVLRHELAHSFVHAGVPHCPVWLNEGLAQIEESRDLDTLAAHPENVFRTGEAIPLRDLEGPFVGFTSERAQTAYSESLAATEYLRAAYGMTGLRLLLQHLANGETTEKALQAVTMGGYADLQREVETYVASRTATHTANTQIDASRTMPRR